MGMVMNTQPIEKPQYREDGALDIVRFWRTVQGEGPYAGMPAVFVRTAGCSLACPGCDTLYTSPRQLMSVPDLLQGIGCVGDQHFSKAPLVVITGGEPMRQNLTPLVHALLDRNYYVQIETNGIHWPGDDFPFDRQNLMVVCSPKTPQINSRLAEESIVYKYVLRDGAVDPDDGLPTIALGGLRPARPGNGQTMRSPPPPEQIYLQPEDEEDEALNECNNQAVVRSCMRFGYRLCLQQHKIVGLD